MSSSSSRRSKQSSAGRSSRSNNVPSVRPVITNETWRVLLATDGTAPASKFQRDFVRASVARVTGKRPSLLHLTLGQAARVLEHVGQNPTKLNSSGRGVASIEKAGLIAKWVLFGLLLLFVTASSPAGFVVAAGIVGLVFLLRRRRRNRQAWEDENWATNNVTASEENRDLGTSGIEPSDEVVPERFVLAAEEALENTPLARATTPGLRAPYAISLGRSEWPNVEVVGEHAYGKAINAALRSSGARTAPGRDSDVESVPVDLVAEPDNPYDSNAISVRWNNNVLGYLSRDDAVRYAQPVKRIIASGLTAATTARIWAYDDGSQLRARVTVSLPEPEIIAPLNDAPAGLTTLVPWGTAIQVLKEENHFDVLFNHVPPTGVGLLLVSIHREIRRLKNGTERPFVEVRLDGKRVGELSNVTSAHLLPLLEHTEAVGETAVAYAKVTGSALAAQLVLHAAKATEISNDWLSKGPHPVPDLLPWTNHYEVPRAYAK